jgi:hypothetical protein
MGLDGQRVEDLDRFGEVDGRDQLQPIPRISFGRNLRTKPNRAKIYGCNCNLCMALKYLEIHNYCP